MTSAPAAATLWLAYQSLGRIARALPRPCAYAAARRLMDAAWLAWPQGRRASIANARILLPHTLWNGDAPSLACAQWRAYGEYMADAVRLNELTPAECFDAVDGPAADWARLRDAYGTRPTLFALMHIGNWDVLGGAYTHACGTSHVIADPLGHPGLDQAVQSPRNRLGMTPQSGPAGLRRTVAALRAGGTAAVFLDRPPQGRDIGVSVQLFGRTTQLSSVFERIAAAADAWIVPLAAVRTSPGEFAFQALIDLDAAIPPHKGATQRTLAAFEPHLVAHPNQWYQFSPFFR